LEKCNVTDDIQQFIKDKGTGSEIPAPIAYRNFYQGDIVRAESLQSASALGFQSGNIGNRPIVTPISVTESSPLPADSATSQYMTATANSEPARKVSPTPPPKSPVKQSPDDRGPNPFFDSPSAPRSSGSYNPFDEPEEPPVAPVRSPKPSTPPATESLKSTTPTTSTFSIHAVKSSTPTQVISAPVKSAAASAPQWESFEDASDALPAAQPTVQSYGSRTSMDLNALPLYKGTLMEL
jgi:hypothetical protein